MKALAWIYPVVVLVALAGCAREESGHGDVEASALQLFEKGKGLRLPEEMARTLGVATVEVAERSFQRSIEGSARVYQSGRGTAPGRAIASLSPDQVAPLTIGQPVRLRATPDSMTVTGRLVRIDSQTAALGQVEALIDFPDPEGRQPAGSTRTAEFVVPDRITAYAAPVSAVLQGVDGAFVYTLNGAHFVRTPVKLGAESDGSVEIMDGLYAGDTVVAKGGDAMWMIELCALKGGTPCCPVGKKAAVR